MMLLKVLNVVVLAWGVSEAILGFRARARGGAATVRDRGSLAILLSGLALLTPVVAGLLYRIRVEERALSEALGGEYVDYCKVTNRLIPDLYWRVAAGGPLPGVRTGGLRSMRYHHPGIPTPAAPPGEMYLEEYEAFRTGHGRNPFGIQRIPFEAGCPLPQLVKTLPHVVFGVEFLECTTR